MTYPSITITPVHLCTRDNGFIVNPFFFHYLLYTRTISSMDEQESVFLRQLKQTRHVVPQIGD